MTDDEILDERARLYAYVEQDLPVGTARCLDITLEGHRWLFPKTEVRVLLPHYHVTPLPRGVRWQGWPCPGLVTHSTKMFPMLCWSQLVERRLPTLEQEYALLLLRTYPVALRVPGPVGLSEEHLQGAVTDSRPWSRGQVPSGASWADLSQLGREES